MAILPPFDVSCSASPSDPQLENRVIVTEPSDLSGNLSSTTEYFIDGTIDFTGTGISIIVPVGGLNITGYNFNVSKLICSDINYVLFESPVGGSGDIIGKDYAVEITGAGSSVYDLTDATGLGAFEFSRINYNNCTSLGEIAGYRQGLEVGTGRFGGSPTLTLSGTWVGGFFIDTSIVRGLSPSMTDPLFKAGASFSMQSRFRSNQNIDLPASASFIDFSSSNFVNASTVQLEGMIVTRNGVADATDTNITPNISHTDLVCRWRDNNGVPNTFEGGTVSVATEVTTVISTLGVFETLDALTWSTSNLQHFDSPSGGQLRHLGDTHRDFKVVADLVVDSTSNDNLTVRVAKWDNSLGDVVTVLDQVRQVNSLIGLRNVAFFSINVNTTLDENDYIFLQVANTTSLSNVTLETGSYIAVEAR